MAQKEFYNGIQKKYIAKIVGEDAMRAQGVAAAGLKLNDIQRKFLHKEPPLTKEGPIAQPAAVDASFVYKSDGTPKYPPEKAPAAPAAVPSDPGTASAGSKRSFPTLYADALKKAAAPESGAAAPANKPFQTLYADLLQGQKDAEENRAGAPFGAFLNRMETPERAEAKTDGRALLPTPGITRRGQMTPLRAAEVTDSGAGRSTLFRPDEPSRETSTTELPGQSEPPETTSGGRYDEETGRTYFDLGDGEEVWADMDTLQGIGRLPDGTVVFGGTDEFAQDVYRIIEARDTGAMTEQEARLALGDIAAQIASQKYVRDVETGAWNKLYNERLNTFLHRTLGYYSIPDKTEAFDELLKAAAREIKEQIELNRTLPFAGSFSYNQMIAWLVDKFRNNGEYDLKRTEEYEGHSLFLYHGEIVSRDAFANILFGYIMKQCGFSDGIIHDIASLYQIRSGDFSFIGRGGDDERDSFRIDQGIQMFMNRAKHI